MLKTPKWRTDNEHQVVSNGKGNHEVGSAGAQRGALGRPPKYSIVHVHGAKEKQKREWREYNGHGTGYPNRSGIYIYIYIYIY